MSDIKTNKIVRLANYVPEVDSMQSEFLKSFEAIKLEEEAKIKTNKSGSPWKVAGQGFKIIRNKIGLNQQAFAKLIGVSKTTLSTWETGYFRPRFQTLVGIKYQLLDFGKQIGQPGLSDYLRLEDFGYSKRGDSIRD